MTDQSAAKSVIWTKDRDDALRIMLAAKMTTRAIGEAMGLTQSMVARRIKATGLRTGLDSLPAERVKPDHIADYKKARRGFVVPEHLEHQYYELLKTGVPIVEARRRLGIEAQPEK